ncbi:MAG: metallophosphoesterase [Bacillota bacterium]|nr:metallophosphoesterase [Bacillota bacterium]
MRQFARGKLINCILTAVLSVALTVTMIPATSAGVNAAEKTSATETLNIAILSDIHYVSDENRSGAATEDFQNAEKAENRMMSEIDLILSQALEDAGETNPDAMLVCGDLCSNGELDNENALAAKLVRAETEYGSDIYVVNGNHDINMSYGADFSGDKVSEAGRTQASGFKEVYKSLGYGNNVRYYNAEAKTGTAVKNYGGLSYATEIREGVTLIALDTAQYSGAASAEYDKAQKTAGAVSDGLLTWAKKQAQAAKKKGNLVLAMCHHSLIPHHGVKNKASAMFFSEYLVPNWEKIAGGLADAGVSAVLTGHSHANDISQYTTKAGNTIYDIQTSALCAYPCAWRTLTIKIDRSGSRPSYSFDVESHFMEQVEGLDLTYNGKDYNDLQEYSFVKTGLPEEALPNMAQFLLREQLFEIKSHEGGFSGYLKDKLEVPAGKSVGQYGKEEIAKLMDATEPVDEKFELFGADTELKINLNKKKTTANVKYYNVELTYTTKELNEVVLDEDIIPEEIKLKLAELEEKSEPGPDGRQYVSISRNNGVWRIYMYPIFPEALKAQLFEIGGYEGPTVKKTEKGMIIVDLSGMAKGINAAIGKANVYINGESGDWENNYRRTAIEMEASRAIEEKVVPVLTKPITEGDEETSPLFIARDALQAFARGDEESAVPSIYGDESSSTLNSKRKNWNELIKSEAFEEDLLNTIMDTAYEITDEDRYPQIFDILDTDMSPGDGKTAISVDAGSEKENPTLNALGAGMGEYMKTPVMLIRFVKMLGDMGTNPFKEVPMKDLTGMFAELQRSLTTDVNIKADSNWGFHTVTLAPAGGTVSTNTIMTVEGSKAGALPTPTRKGYNFLGWFTKASAGKKVTGSTDLSSVKKVYAHWKSRTTQMGEDGTAFGKGAAIEAAEKAITKRASEKDPKGAKVAPLLLKSTKQTKNSIKLVWKKPSGAKKYVLFGNTCGPKNKMKKLRTVTGTSITVKKAVKKLKKGKYYKFMIVALNKKNNVISSSRIVHAATKGGKVGNHKKVTVKKAVLTKAKNLKVGKSLSIKPSLVLQSKKLKFKKHVAVRYESTNPKVAAVSAKGRLTAKKKGSCKVYVYAQNGVVKTIPVRVK